MLDTSNSTRAFVAQFIPSFQSGYTPKEKEIENTCRFRGSTSTEGQIFSLSAQMSAVPLSRGNDLLFYDPTRLGTFCNTGV
jgi:hypothetical protein